MLDARGGRCRLACRIVEHPDLAHLRRILAHHDLEHARRASGRRGIDPDGAATGNAGENGHGVREVLDGVLPP
jgi:hypothetical protein